MGERGDWEGLGPVQCTVGMAEDREPLHRLQEQQLLGSEIG